jgi:mannose-6-phosphate isomerase
LNAVLFFQPVYRARLWGGDRLRQLFGRELPPGVRVGESWELFAFGGESNRIVGGPWSGWPFQEFLRQLRHSYSELLLEEFPLLLKWIDSAARLSVQVHPWDGHPLVPSGQRGKTECWVVVDADPGAELFVGVKPGVTEEQLAETAAKGDLELLLVRHRVAAGDVFFVPAGTVHAIGPGVLLAEVQQASDVTYRLYDWGRTDSESGQPRPLHLSSAVRCLRLHDPRAGRREPKPLEVRTAWVRELLVGTDCCEAFWVERVRMRQSLVAVSEGGWYVGMVLRGSGCLQKGEETWELRAGQTFLSWGPTALSLVPVSPMELLVTGIPDVPSPEWAEKL